MIVLERICCSDWKGKQNTKKIVCSLDKSVLLEKTPLVKFI